jgi:uncharacterized membrane protein
MTETQFRPGELPAHIEEIINSINKMHDAHRDGATRYERIVGGATALMASSGFIGALILMVAGWVGFNLLCASLGRPPLDPPPFSWLEGGISLLSLLMVAAIVAEQRREDQIGRQREFLTLQLAILSERKAAKLIALFEEFRRDSPQIHDRVDKQAEELSQSASPQTVLDAINQRGRTG